MLYPWNYLPYMTLALLAVKDRRAHLGTMSGIQGQHGH